MKQRVYISIFLALAVLLAGCIGGGSSKTQIVSRDMLVIKSIDIFPSKTLQPDDSIIIRMEVENAGQADAHLLVDAGKKTDDKGFGADYLLIDHCKTLYRTTKDAQVLSGGRCEAIYADDDKAHKYPLIPLVKDSAGNPIKDGCYMKLAPQGSHTFQWTLKAPPENEIAKMTQKCAFKFQTAYAAQAVTNTYVYFADPLEIAQRLYTKKEMSLAGDNVASYGPVAVNFVPAEPQPIPVRKEGNEKWTVFLNLRNVGTGIADVSDIEFNTGAIEMAGSQLMGCGGLNKLGTNLALISAFKESGISDEASLHGALEVYKTCDDSTPACKIDLKQLAEEYGKEFCSSSSGIEGSNDEGCSKTISEIGAALEETRRKLQIPFQQSSRIPCGLTMPEGVTILTPFKFTTTADYTYKIRQDIDITTKPIREGA